MRIVPPRSNKIEFVERVIQCFYVIHTARQGVNHRWQSRIHAAEEREIYLGHLYLILVVALLSRLMFIAREKTEVRS